MAQQWLSLVATIWLQSINGTNSNFAAYSSELKRILSLSQLQLNNLAFASDAGKLLGWISGLAGAHLPLWLVLLIGSFLGLVGYGVQYLFLTNQIVTSLSYWQVFALTVLAGNSVCWINTVCYIIAIRNFPLDRQIAVGLSTSYVGLSAKVYTDVVDVFVAPSNSPSERAKLFLLFNSVLPLAVCVVAAPLARDVAIGKSKELSGGFLTLFVITVVTGIFAIVSSLGSMVTRLLLPSKVVLAGMVVLLFLPLVAPLVEKIREKVQRKCSIRVYNCGDNNNNNNKNNNLEIDDLEIGKMETIVGIVEIGAKAMLRKVEFWLYFFVYLFGGTLGLVYMNNLGQIAESRGCSGTSSLVSLCSAFGFFGRILPSLLDYFFSKTKFVLSRAMAMGAMIVPMCGAFFLVAISKQDYSLYSSTAIIGICTGAITSLSVSATTELFGAENFGVNHNILVSNIPIGSFLFGGFAAFLYKRERYLGEENCMGERCYQTTFIIWGSLCLLGTLLALILHARTKKIAHN
ncbi:hypothetical protein ABFX02_14G068500 [Erythranthe guttata]